MLTDFDKVPIIKQGALLSWPKHFNVIEISWIVVVGILLSRGQWSMGMCGCSTCRGCTFQYGNDRLSCICCGWAPLLALWRLDPKLKLPSAVCVLSSLPTGLLLSLARLDTLLDGKRPFATAGSCSFSAYWVNVASLHVAFADICIAKDRPSYRSGASCKLTVQHVLGDPFALHAADMAKPAHAPLRQPGKHAWYSCLGQDILVGDAIPPSDPQNPPEVVQAVEGEYAFLVGVYWVQNSLP